MRYVLACAILFVTLPAQAQDTLVVKGAKDPGTAKLFSVLITGGGHLYAGETGTGLALMGIAAGGAGLGYYLTAQSAEVKCDRFGCDDETNWRPALMGGLVAVGAWLYGITESDDAVRRYNQSLAIKPTRRGITLAWRF